MKRKKITMEVEVFEAKDFEKAYEKYLKRKGLEPKKVSISDMEFSLLDYIPADTGIPEGMGFYISIDGNTVGEWSLFWDEEKEGYYLPSGKLIGDSFWTVNVKDSSVLFDFDIKQFKSFYRYTDSSD